MIAPPAALPPADRRLAALAAAFAPDGAARILGRLAGGEEAAAWGSALAALPRAGRLAALADSLASVADPAGLGTARALLDAERPSVAHALRALVVERTPGPARPSPVLARAALERLAALRRPPDGPAGA